MRGQISLDLMMAVLVTLIVLGTMFAAVDSVRQSHQEIFIENQLKKITSEQASFITSLNALGDISVDAEVRAPVIYFENRKLSPNLDINANTITASVFVRGRTISSSSTFVLPAGASISYDENRILEVVRVA